MEVALPPRRIASSVAALACRTICAESILNLHAGDLDTQGLGLGAAVGILLAGQQQAGTAAHAVERARSARQRARQRVGQADRLVEPGEELVGGDGQLPEGPADRQRRPLELAIQPLDGAQQRGEHRVGGELALGAELAQFADGDAELARQCLRQGRQAFEDAAQIIALQRARPARPS